MATVNKNFKIKHGLVVEGATGTINGEDILTKKQDDIDFIIEQVGGSGVSENTPDTLVLRDEFGNFAAGEITASLQGNVTGDVTGTVSDISNHNTDGLSEGSSNKYFTDQRALDATAEAYDAAGAAAQALTDANAYTDTEIATAIGEIPTSTDELSEGTTNLYYTDLRAREAVGASEGLDYNSTTGVFSADLGNGLQIDGTGQIEIDNNVVATKTDLSTDIGAHSDATSGVHGVTGDVVGTSDAQALTNKELGSGTTLGASIDAEGFTVTNLAEPTQASDAATKGYVDAVAEGLHVHASVSALADSNVSLPTAPAAVDGVTLSVNDRVLLVGQTAPAENGIYVVVNGDLARAADYDTAEEIQAGDFVFVSGGSVYGSTGWVQENVVTTLSTDPIVWDQFSGAGTFSAGSGLTLTGTEFAIDTDVTATKTHVDDMVDAHSDLTTGVHGVTGDVVGTSDTQTLTSKTLGTGTVLGADLDGANTYKVVNLADPTSNQDAATKKYVDDEVSGVQGALDNLTTTDVSEGDNLYYTDSRVKDVLTGSTQTNISITEVEGVLTITAENGVGDSTTDDLSEGATNLYFTDARAQSAVAGDITSAIDALDTDDIEEGVSNLYFTDQRALDATSAAYDPAGSAATAESNANSYTDGRETAITTAYQSYADISETNAISAAASDATTKADAAQLAAEQYADGLAVNYDAAGSAATAESNANGYTDSLIGDNTVDGTSGNTVSDRIASAVSNLVDGAPELLDTLNELAAAIGDNPDTISNLQDLAAGKQDALTPGANIDITDATISVTGLDTDDVSEGTNLYFTSERAVDALEAVVPNFTEIDINSVATQVAATGSATASVENTVYSFAKADYRSAKFLVKVAYSTHTEISEVLLTLDTSDNIAITEYAIVGTNGSLSTVSAEVSGDNVNLLVNPANTSIVTVMGTLLA
jgi:hypothetical protein